MRVCILDDEIYAVKLLEKKLNNIAGIEICGTFTDPETALAELRKLKPDVLFLDMDLLEVNGIQFAENLLEEQLRIEVIFVTAHSQFALNAFDVNAADYLLKPVQTARLEKAVARAAERVELYKQRIPQRKSENKSFNVYAFGALRLICQDGSEFKWRTRKGKELFTFLWHHRTKPIHKSKVIDAIWPELDAEKAISLLYTTVYQLRKKLKDAGVQENPIKLKNDYYTLEIPSLTSDVDELNTLLKNNIESDQQVEKIMELYAGDYLEEEDYFWAYQTRLDLRGRVLFFLEAFIKEEIETRANYQLIEKCLEKMLRMDPINEHYMMIQMQFYAKSNQLSKMKLFYERIAASLEDEVGIDVPDEITDIYNRSFQST
jgi:two-component SAPR family response regulator